MGKYNDYNELENELGHLPLTWYPALIIKMIKTAYEKRVFIPGGASHLAKRIEEEIGQEKK